MSRAEDMATGNPTNPPFYYFGGKWDLATWIISHFPEHRVYAEPFGGAASVLLRKRSAVVDVYNDLNDEVVAFFRTLRDPSARRELIGRLELTPFSRTEFELARRDAGGDADEIERVRRFVVRSSMSIGAHAKAKNATAFRSGPGAPEIKGARYAHVWRNRVDNLETIAGRFRSVIIECRDYRWLVERYDTRHTLFYCDPPYVGHTRSGTEEYEHEMAEPDLHRGLADVLAGIKGMAVVSGYRCDLYDELFRGWARKDVVGRDQRNSRRLESIWLSPNIRPVNRLF